MSQGLWQNVVEIIQHDNQRQHALMMALARGDIPYGQFVQESTQITARTTAAVQPFIQEAGVIDQVAMAQTDQPSAAALEGEKMSDEDCDAIAEFIRSKRGHPVSDSLRSANPGIGWCRRPSRLGGTCGHT